MVRDCGTLDLNSPYYYLTMSQWFSETCRLAEDRILKRLIGLLTGFRQPSNPDTLFVWQIAVDKRYQGRGIARKLLDEVTDHPEIRYLEATIAPSNHASRRLFASWASSRGASIVTSPGFDETCFPDGEHEREDLYRIGPIK
ncbi:diaminobutyrate acetyltransferase [Paenibacillus spongiae]|uniref:L-2,4-diaminobutyric acid acetyltransferase n=1 Tax=Paenibacillus spongiae TaxID=2909671 RepID=A0ABY5SI43_9BACL|nr:diaminobutyrate acetyltransferase [Paenibacillus spongiae]UVI33233.1 diaminobutyrate acetyltransferase [Paenibacillus spongiae]